MNLIPRLVLRIEDLCAATTVYGPGPFALPALKLQIWLHHHTRAGALAKLYTTCKIRHHRPVLD